MCGIAGLIDLTGRRPLPGGVLQKMADVLFHRGPDEDGFLERPGLGLASRRLSIVGLADGQQPIYNEDRSVAIVYNGELFDYPEKRQMLKDRGHRLATSGDTEIIPHLWEDHQEEMFEHLRGQFAFALWDDKQQTLLLARDKFGVCPLFWTQRSALGPDWLLFASEIKALLSSGLIDPQPDVHGIDHVFNFFALPGPVSCFQGIEALLPGHFLRIQRRGEGRSPDIRNRAYFQMDFPDRGDEVRVDNTETLIDEFESILQQSVQRRLRADVPVVWYLSGGIDSSIIVAMAVRHLGRSIPTFTIQIKSPEMDETAQAAVASRHVGVDPIIVQVGDDEVLNNYQRVMVAGEGPVVDTSCAAMMLLAQEVNRQGYKVGLMGEGSDEWLAGYSWFKVNRFLGFFDVVPGINLSPSLRRVQQCWSGTPDTWRHMRDVTDACGGFTAFHEIYSLMASSRERFYSPAMKERLKGYNAYASLQPDAERIRRWHPIHKASYWGFRILLPGNNLSLKGDRVAMHSAVETRYPFLDEEVYRFLAPLHPRYKLRGFRDKLLLRLLGERWLPKSIAWAPKGMFRAPLDSFFINNAPPYVDQLLSAEALAKTGYFDAAAVNMWRSKFRKLRNGSYWRSSVELGLSAVVATQLWHHTFIDDTLADLPNWRTILDDNTHRLRNGG